MTTSASRWRLRAAVAISAAAVSLVPAAAAHAATIVTITYDAAGTSTLKKPNAVLELKPTKLTTNVDIDTGKITGTLPLKPTSVKFTLSGIIPTSAEVEFIPVGEVTGQVDLTQTQAKVKSVAQYIVQLKNIKIFGFPTFTGSTCKTVDPIVVDVTTPEGEGFDIIEGGNLIGTYTLGNFANCGINTAIANASVTGPGNTIAIKASGGIVAE